MVSDRRFLDYEKMAQLCAIAKVTDAQHFSNCIHDLVERIWRVEQNYEALNTASDLKVSAGRIARAAQALDEAIGAASEQTKEAVGIKLSPRFPKALAELHMKVTRLATAAGQVRRLKKPLAIRGLFINQLINDAAKSGGKLTRGENGSLIRALDCLEPHLPPRFSVSLSTVKRTLGSKKKQSGQKY